VFGFQWIAGFVLGRALVAYFAEGLDTVDKVLVSILLLVVTDGFGVVF